MHRSSRGTYSRFIASVMLALLVGPAAVARQAPAPARGPLPVHGRAAGRLLIRNAMVIYGNGKPAFGPVDILVRDGLIARVGATPPGDPAPDAVIDATGKYVMPGLINAHMHLQDERGGRPQPLQYELNLYLASGATTVRDVGSDLEKSKTWRAQSAAHTLVSPRILIYTPQWRTRSTAAADLLAPTGASLDALREGIRWAKEQGADGLKFFGMDRDQLEVSLDEARRQGLRSAAHIAVEETTARDYAELGVTSIEHFYGVADAALDGIQDFPPEHNANNEIHRFGRAGELYLQKNLNRGKLSEVLDLMVAKKVVWCPTMDAYVASRDLIRSQNVPWFGDYLHPTMEEYWKPDLLKHGSYFFGWTNTQEVRWKKDMDVWMGALREFANKGGVITTGDDAGFIYNLYGFGLVRELELLEEAGFHPLEVLAQATVNGAKLIGMEDRLGRVRQGFVADLLVVNGNPLENLRVLNPFGADVVKVGGRVVSNYSAIAPGDGTVEAGRGGGIEWTIKEGVAYHVPRLMEEVKAMVVKARAER